MSLDSFSNDKSISRRKSRFLNPFVEQFYILFDIFFMCWQSSEVDINYKDWFFPYVNMFVQIILLSHQLLGNKKVGILQGIMVMLAKIQFVVLK